MPPHGSSTMASLGKFPPGTLGGPRGPASLRLEGGTRTGVLPQAMRAFCHNSRAWEIRAAATVALAAKVMRHRMVSARCASGSNAIMTLVDGHYHIYKSFHATKYTGLCNQRGEPTNVVYSFMQQLESIHRECEPSHMAVILDSKTSSSSRREVLPQYKKHRRCPEELLVQVPKVIKACSAMGVQWRMHEDFEADDVIASYTRRFSAQVSSGHVKIVSSDKDLLELVGDQVELLYSDPRNPQAPFVSMDKAEVWNKWGVRPEQMPDLLALMGDAADNIPGVQGIGAKRAAALLQHCGSLETIVRRAQEGTLSVKGVSPRLCRFLCEQGPRALDLLERVVRLKEVSVEPEFHCFKVPERDESWHDRVATFCDSEDMTKLKERLSGAKKAETGRMHGERGDSDFSRPVSRPPERQDTGKVLEVRTLDEARKALELLRNYPDATFAVFSASDDEHPRPPCLAIYGGPSVCLGQGKTKVWVDLLESSEEMLGLWRDFLADPLKKVYHVYAETQRGLSWGCIPHIPERGGFVADVMHLARLWDPTLNELTSEGAYSLAWLAETLLGATWRLQRPQGESGRKKIADLQQGRCRKDWIQLCADSAAAVFYLHQELQSRLAEQAWQAPKEALPASTASLLDFYTEHWQPLAMLLSDMELRGVPVNRQRLEALISESSAAQASLQHVFCSWAIRSGGLEEASASVLNLNSNQQVAHLLFGSGEREFPGSVLSAEEPAIQLLPEAELSSKKVPELKELCRERALMVSGNKPDLIQRLCDPQVQAQARARRAPPPLKVRGLSLDEGGTVTRTARTGSVQLTLETLQALADREQQLQTEAAEPLQSLLFWRQHEAQLGFLRPLQGACHGDRVHALLNLNTATGRLSTRSPNLQGEPKGRGHTVRSVVAAPSGKRLLVADYGQLELRLVAHLSDCPTMISILAQGGDIHSRTAYHMFEEVRQRVDEGQVALEGDSGGVVTVKDHFPELRKRAKTLNFALLYGKTAFSLAKDWDLSQGEASGIIDRWFQTFPEIEAWMKQLHQNADSSTGATAVTLLGRRRQLGRLTGRSFIERGRTQRVAGNTPVQGSAADVVLSAMVKVERSEVLRRLGYHLVLQIHDELLLEGPEENANEALAELVRLMEDPLPFKLRVPLKVNASHVQTWKEAEV